MMCFPVFADLENKEVFVCGETERVYDKIKKLQPFHPKIKIFSKNVSKVMMNDQKLIIERRPLTEEDLKSFPAFVIADGTDEENQRIRNLCQEHHVLINVVDQPKLCDFIFPSLITTKNLCIGISSGGTSPTATVHMKGKIEQVIPTKIDEILDKMPEIRMQIRTWSNEKQVQTAALKKVVEQSFLKNRCLTDEELNKIKQEI